MLNQLAHPRLRHAASAKDLHGIPRRDLRTRRRVRLEEGNLAIVIVSVSHWSFTQTQHNSELPLTLPAYSPAARTTYCTSGT